MRIIVNSLPKSGTHLLSRLMDLIGFTGHAGPQLAASLVRITARNPVQRLKIKMRQAPQNIKTGLPVDLDVDENWIRKDWLNHYLCTITQGSYITGHLPYKLELSEFFAVRGFRSIFIYRDPRDVLVSFANFIAAQNNYPFHSEFNKMNKADQIRATLEGMKNGDNVIDSLQGRIERAKGWVTDPNTLSVRFEDLIGESGEGNYAQQIKCIRNILEWIGVNATDERVSFLANNVFYKKSSTFNKGIIGQWRTVLDESLIDSVNESCGKLIAELRYE